MDEPINILLIEDNPGDVRLIKEVLNDPDFMLVNLIVADSIKEGLKLIATNLIHVILLDLNLPDSSGIETFKKIKKYSRNIPVIILSVLSQKELIFEAMLEGAQEYLIKGEIENEFIVRAIRYALWHYQLIE